MANIYHISRLKSKGLSVGSIKGLLASINSPAPTLNHI